MLLVVKNSLANAGEVRDIGSIPGFGRSPGGGHGNPLQSSCLGNHTDREAWLATVLVGEAIELQRAGHHRSDVAHARKLL